MSHVFHFGRYQFFPFLLLSILLISAACAAAPANRAPEGAPPPTAPAPGLGSNVAEQASTERMIVRAVILSLVVADVETALAEIRQVTDDLGGYTVTSESSESNGNRSGRVTLRIPTAKLDDAVAHIKALAQRVPRENRTNKDVTEEYVDQDARLRNLKATEAQYLDILKGAKTIEETLNVRKALSEVRDQIERTEARLQFLRHSVEMASISADLTTSAAAQSLQWGDWNVTVTFRQAVQGLVNLVQLLVTLGIWMVVLAPVWLPACLAFRWWRRRRLQKASAPPAP